MRLATVIVGTLSPLLRNEVFGPSVLFASESVGPGESGPPAGTAALRVAPSLLATRMA